MRLCAYGEVLSVHLLKINSSSAGIVSLVSQQEMLIFSTPHPAPPYLRLEFFTIAFVSCFSNLFFGLIWARPSVFLGQGFAFLRNVNMFLKVSSSRTSHSLPFCTTKLLSRYYACSFHFLYLLGPQLSQVSSLRWSLFSFSWSDRIFVVW